MHRVALTHLVIALTLVATACGDGNKNTPPPAPEPDADVEMMDVGEDTEDPPDVPDGPDAETMDVEQIEDVPLDADLGLEHPPPETIFGFANQCINVGLDYDDGGPTRWLTPTENGDGFAFEAQDTEGASKFVMRASALGTFLFYDQDSHYLVDEDTALLRSDALESDITMIDADFISGAEWHLEFSQRVSMRYQLRSRRTGRLLVTPDPSDATRAADLVLEPAEGCAEHPEMALNATGTVTRTTYEDGDLFGYVDTHSHILSSTGFGGGGIFHGGAYHRLGVEHALGSCEPFHGPEGRADLLTWGLSEDANIALEDLVLLLTNKLLDDPQHETDGWPTFSGWPSPTSLTHQTQYYRWLERAWMSGLRLVVQHAVSNEALCDIIADVGIQPTLYGCEDMRNIDRQLVEIRRLEDYIDAQHGGPGKGWFKVVESPAQAREVIEAGNMAVILGIEVPNLFDCYLTRREGGPVCDEAHINAQLDHYQSLGVRALFPTHKYDNAFSPGDGAKGILEIANVMQSGHWNSYTDDCPDVPTAFDKGRVVFGGFNEARDEHISPPPNDLIRLTMNPLNDLLPFLSRIMEPALEGDWCQKHGLTPAGATLIEGILDRGMILEIDHLPRRSHTEVFETLVEADYPAAATHSNTYNGQIYEIGGVSKVGFGRCGDANNPGSRASGFRARRDMQVAAGTYTAEGFGFDLNGLVKGPGPRFGPDSNCRDQENPVEYPFTSYAGDVTFLEPSVGDRVIDFNNEGMMHIGLVPELIEDVRRTGVSDEDLDLLFRSAEGYIRMWERAEARAAER